MARCVLGFAVLNVMNAVICLDYCRYDKSILPRRLSKPLPSVWPTFFLFGDWPRTVLSQGICTADNAHCSHGRRFGL